MRSDAAAPRMLNTPASKKSSMQKKSLGTIRHAISGSLLVTGSIHQVDGSDGSSCVCQISCAISAKRFSEHPAHVHGSSLVSDTAAVGLTKRVCAHQIRKPTRARTMKRTRMMMKMTILRCILSRLGRVDLSGGGMCFVKISASSKAQLRCVFRRRPKCWCCGGVYCRASSARLSKQGLR